MTAPMAAEAVADDSAGAAARLDASARLERAIDEAEAARERRSAERAERQKEEV